MNPRRLRGSQTGVFAGATSAGYAEMLRASAEEMAGFALTAGSSSVISGRVAYVLGLEGPAMTVDTACSASLVAMHLAMQALRQGECSLALAGGVMILFSPFFFVDADRQGGLATDGRCKSFAEAADGTGLSEGVGMVTLQRLSDAEREGNPILAVLRGSAVNQDGASNGLTAPNGPSQERVIRQALANAGLAPQDVDAVEAHGTGTVLGDPIEAGALLATYGQEREEPLKLGSIKSNIGHPAAAAGVAGVIKMTMALRKGLLPKTLHVDAPSSKIDWDSGQVELLTESAPWQPNGKPRRAAVSSFGVSGTNAHLILEEAPGQAPLSEPGQDLEQGDVRPLPGPILLPLSAKTEPALGEAASRLAAHLEENPDLEPLDVSHSLIETRSRFEHRAVVLGSERRELLASLSALAEDRESPAVAKGVVRAEQRPVFVFPGQGSQWLGMGLELIEASPAFAAQMQACEEALSPYVNFSLPEVLAGAKGAPPMERVDVVQPVLFAVMVSLAKLWRECGVEPGMVVGHSQGEIAAAHVAGGLSLEDAARLVALRSKSIASLTGQGGMVSVALGGEKLEALLEPFADRVTVAAHNGPSSTILSADREALDLLMGHCEGEGVRVRKILAAVAASHSAHMEPLREEVLEALAPIVPRSGEIPLYSTVTAASLDTCELGPEYWYRNMREPVLFEQVTRRLLKEGQRTFIEVSPHPVFALALRETIEDALDDPSSAAVLATLRREEGGPDRFALSLAQAHAAGARQDWSALFKGTKPKRVPLPTYPFQRKRYWPEGSQATADVSAAGLVDADHPLLGASVELAAEEGLLLSGRLSLKTHAWLADHAVFGSVLLPGAVFVELALQAGSQLGCEVLEELALQVPLILSETAATQIQVAVSGPGEEGRRQITIHSRPEGAEDGQWVTHAQGTLCDQAPEPQENLGAWPPPEAEQIDLSELYERLAEGGIEYGPAFQGLTAAWRKAEDVYVEVSLDQAQHEEAGSHAVHPALLDAALHGTDLLAASQGQESPKLHARWHGVCLGRGGQRELRARIRSRGEGVSLLLADQAGAPVGQVDCLVSRQLEEGEVVKLRPAIQDPEGATPRQRKAPLRRRETVPQIHRLADMPEAERGDAVLTLVREQAAAVLGHESPQEVQTGQAFQELGFDSVGLVELRNRINASLSLSVPIVAFIDRPTIGGVSEYILGQLASQTENGSGANLTLTSMLGSALERGALEEFMEMLTSASGFRQEFSEMPSVEDLPRPLHLAEGDGSPSLVLIPSTTPMSGPHEYVKFAQALQGKRAVYAFPVPGFAPGETLPKDFSVAVQTQAEAILQSGIGMDFALAGYSSGGWFAHTVATHLEQRGFSPKAVILLDTYSPRSGILSQLMPMLMAEVQKAVLADVGIDDTRLTAMARYLSLFAEWEPQELSAPVLLTRASEPGPAMQANDVAGWQASWEHTHASVDVPGSHFTLLQQHASGVAEAVDRALNNDLMTEST